MGSQHLGSVPTIAAALIISIHVAAGTAVVWVDEGQAWVLVYQIEK
jgi:hypothetical protein